MPEGDTLYNLALLLGPALDGETLTAVSFPRLRGLDRLKVGDLIAEVRARGKYLEVEVERGLVLRTRLRMTGDWHLYEPGQRWRRPKHSARAVLEVDEAVAVCFVAPVVEIGRRGDDALDHLGPDLCRPPVDTEEILRRLDAWANPEVQIADVLLDQRLAAGIGNVYKCESLFACGIDPFRTLGEVDAATRLLGYSATRLLGGRCMRLPRRDCRRTSAAGVARR